MLLHFIVKVLNVRDLCLLHWLAVASFSFCWLEISFFSVYFLAEGAKLHVDETPETFVTIIHDGAVFPGVWGGLRLANNDTLLNSDFLNSSEDGGYVSVLLKCVSRRSSRRAPSPAILSESPTPTWLNSAIKLCMYIYIYIFLQGSEGF